MKKSILYLFLLLGTLSFSQDKFKGYWMMPDGNFIIKIDKSDKELYEGVVVWLKNPTYFKGDRDEGKIQTDRNNPDKSLRARPVLGLQIVGDLNLEGERLKGGWVYDSWNGKEYYGRAKLSGSDTLKLKGSMDKFGILGYTMKAHRVKDKDLGIYGLEKQGI